MNSHVNYRFLWASVCVGFFVHLFCFPNTKLTEHRSQKSFLSNMVYSGLQTKAALMGPVGIYGEQKVVLPSSYRRSVCVEENSFCLLDKFSIVNENVLIIQLFSIPCRGIFLGSSWWPYHNLQIFFYHIVELDSKSFSVLILVLLEGSSYSTNIKGYCGNNGKFLTELSLAAASLKFYFKKKKEKKKDSVDYI